MTLFRQPAWWLEPSSDDDAAELDRDVGSWSRARRAGVSQKKAVSLGAAARAPRVAAFTVCGGAPRAQKSRVGPEFHLDGSSPCRRGTGAGDLVLLASVGPA